MNNSVKHVVATRTEAELANNLAKLFRFNAGTTWTTDAVKRTSEWMAMNNDAELRNMVIAGLRAAGVLRVQGGIYETPEEINVFVEYFAKQDAPPPEAEVEAAKKNILDSYRLEVKALRAEIKEIELEADQNQRALKLKMNQHQVGFDKTVDVLKSQLAAERANNFSALRETTELRNTLKNIAKLAEEV